MAAFINSHRAQMGVHKVLYQPHRATRKVVYKRSIVAVCVQSDPIVASRVTGAIWARINANNNGVGCE